MTTQTAYVAGLNVLIAALNSSKGVSAETKEYWEGLLDKALDKKLSADGAVQSTLSNPLAYFAVPLCSDKESGRGRTKEFTLEQFKLALSKGWTVKADKALRGVNQDAINAGLAASWARKDSALGLKEERRLAAKSSNNNRIALMEATNAKLAAKKLEREAAKAAKKGNTPPVEPAENKDEGSM